MSEFHEAIYYSVLHGRRVRRVSLADPHGGEHFVLLDYGLKGEALGQARDNAISCIEHAIASDLPPGEVALPKERFAA